MYNYRYVKPIIDEKKYIGGYSFNTDIIFIE